MVRRSRIFRRLLFLEAVGFGLVVTIVWLDEWLDLPHRLFGAPPTPVRVAEALLETVLAVLVGAGVIAISRRAFARIEYLESLVYMCAWCRRVRRTGEGDDWLTVESFLEREHQAATSHGICDDCARQIASPLGAGSDQRIGATAG
jgi:hypothetical protein